MVNQVKIVGILMIAHSVLVMLYGVLIGAMGPMMMAFAPAGGGGQGGPPPELFLVIYIAMGAFFFILGGLQLFAGVKTMRFQSRIFGVVMLFMNIILLMTCYCFPTGLALMIYGLIVLFNQDATRAFDMVKRGATPEQAMSRYTRHYDDVRSDYDDVRQRDEDQEDDRDEDDDRRR
jgi:hypothetical protein